MYNLYKSSSSRQVTIFICKGLIFYLGQYLMTCSYICNCLKMPKKSQINDYSDNGDFAKAWDFIFSPRGVHYVLCLRITCVHDPS